MFIGQSLGEESQLQRRDGDPCLHPPSNVARFAALVALLRGVVPWRQAVAREMVVAVAAAGKCQWSERVALKMDRGWATGIITRQASDR